MTRYEELIAAITAAPHDDAPRVAFADHVRASEPARAAFIDAQLLRARGRRARRDPADGGPDEPLRRYGAEWTRLIAKYARRWKFDRGFIAEVAIEPHLFLEYGEWLLVNYPIVHVQLVAPERRAFPVRELAESPLLRRLDAVSVIDVALSAEAVGALVASPHATRLRYLSVGATAIAADAARALAAQPAVQRLLVLRWGEGFPGQRFVETDVQDLYGRYRMAWSELAPLGRELEAQHGYLPWLHHENRVDPLDVAWYVQQSVLPARAPGAR